MGTLRISQASFMLLAVLLTGAIPVRATAEGTVDKALSSQPGLATPHADSKGRAGTWWWPRSSTGEDAKGNQGRVFGRRDATTETKAEMEPPPPPSPIWAFSKPICGGVINYLLFDRDGMTLKPEGKAECDKLARELLKHPGDTLVLVGHTDDTGSAEYNLKLGERRAQAGKDYLVSQGVAPERIGIRSMGETQPAVPNDSPANRALNRRVAFEIKLGD